MLSSWIVIVVAFGYIGLLFAIASYGDRPGRGPRGRAGVLIYPLSLAIYCTSWTFFGSVGFAARTGPEFLAIYIGPVIMVGLCTPLLLRVIRLAKAQKITSIADFIAARYGKSQPVAAMVALIAITGSVPYIALQLKAVATSLETLLVNDSFGGGFAPVIGDIALIVTTAMALFAVAFGTRHTDVTEHQHGLMLAIASESIVKLVAFLAVGACVTFVLFGPHELLARAMRSPEASHVINYTPSVSSFAVMTLLSFFAALLLPRQFHVGVVENADESEVRRARWMFPLYLVAINVFVIPIALAGLIKFPFGYIDSDMYVLALPLAAGSQWLTIVAFVGGLSAATAMVIVESVALAVMVSNTLVMPLLLQRRAAATANADLGSIILKTRRLAIFGVLLLAYLYYRSAGNAQLASMGLLSFAAAAQLAPAFFGGLVWRRATALGAIGGMVVGIAIWAYTLLLPSFADAGIVTSDIVREGLFGMAALRPQALFGSEMQPLLHGVVWSLSLNIVTYVALSLLRAPTSIERLQADVFGPARFEAIAPNFRRWRGAVTVGDLVGAAGQYLGPERARAAFEEFAASNRLTLEPAATADFQLLRHAERLIASTIGVASARRVLSLLLRKRTVSATAALRLLDDAHAALHYNQEILQTALNHVRQGIAVFNADLRLICSNRQFGELLDLPARVVQVGVSLRDILESLEAKANPAVGGTDNFIGKRIAAYTREGEPFLERLVDRNLVIEVRTNRMPDDGFVITFSDITPSVEAAEALERANATLERRVRERTEELTRLNTELGRAKGEAEEANISKTRFLAAASHDLLQPLHAARLYVTSLADRKVEGDAGRLVTNIGDSLEAIEELLGALLDISRLDAGALKPSITSFRISDILRSLEIEFLPIAREKGLDLHFVQSSVPIHSDRILLLRLLQNLTSNAIKYTPQGRVLIGCRRRGKSLQIDVYDRGLGIPETKRRDIFKEFYRLDQGARIARGLGLGLSIVQRMARVLNHGLALDANRGGGSHFSVTVPIADTVAHIGTIANVMAASRMPLEGALIVCVENDPAIIDGMRTLLTGWGAEVIAETDGAAAIAAIEASHRTPTGVLVDYHLDRGNGLAVIRDIRERFGQGLPAILITADRSPSVREAIRSSNIRLFNKPIKPAALRAMLGQWSKKRMVAAE
jgi:Na+/proline symporter/CheY-like chemotaxis protein/PAS domain-containing protein/two-component sensor histidine kinase